MNGIVLRIVIFCFLLLVATVQWGGVRTEAGGKTQKPGHELYSAPDRTVVLNRVALGKKAAPYTTFTSIDIPGAEFVGVTANNNRGQIVGAFLDEAGWHGFLLQNGDVTEINIPGMVDIRIQDINNSGVMIGTMMDVSNSSIVAFVLKGQTWTTLPSPLEPLGINDKGEIVGDYYGDDGRIHGFLFDQGEVTTIDVPGAENTWIEDINNRGDMVGAHGYSIFPPHSGFVLSHGVFNTIDHPSGFSTSMRGINNRGKTVGVFAFDAGWKSFVFYRGQFSHTLVFPDTTGEGVGTLTESINDRGQIAGTYQDASGNARGFLLE
ncbi:MAG: hypothetical protein EHM23_12955 [Acidobacteria bacterium]|nr:MAG: hypothetical protein EHM23_12955 [Acidobacteriota bacterium]